ncbi:MAG: ATP-binding protein, partial [Cytophagales bacterium]
MSLAEQKPPITKLSNINIRPDVSVLSTFRHLKYTPYHALAEFVDNAIDSYLKNKQALKGIAGDNYQLTVKIEFNTTDNKIVIRDNAAGIHTRDFPRAFRPAAIPPDTSKLSEFGMGMKSAAFWFTKNWEVRTSALGESIESTIS